MNGQGTQDQESAYRSSLTRTKGGPWWWQVVGVLSSLPMAATQIATLAIIITLAAWYEKYYGRLAAALHIYQAPWFDALFVLLAVTIFGAALTRWPWRRRHAGFVVVHAGLLTIMAGFWMSGHDRLDGILETYPGKVSRSVTLRQDQIVVVDGQTRSEAQIDTMAVGGFPSFARFFLSPILPIPPLGLTTLDAPVLVMKGSACQAQVVVRQVAISAESELGYRPAESGQNGQPRLAFQLLAKFPGTLDFTPQLSQWLDPQAYDTLDQEPLRVTTAMTNHPAITQAFIDTTPVSSSHGHLVVAWLDEHRKVDVTGKVGQEIVLGGRRVIIDAVYTHAALKADRSGIEERFDGPENPVIMYRFERLDGSFGRLGLMARNPINSSGEGPEIWWRHPLEDRLIPGQMGQEVHFLATPKGEMFIRWRSYARGLLGARPIPEGSSVISLTPPESAMQLQAHLRWLPTAVRAPQPIAMLPEALERLPRWFALEATRRNPQGEVIASGRAWLSGNRRDSQHGFVDMSDGSKILVAISPALEDLGKRFGFTVRLDQYQQGNNLGNNRAASFTSDLTIQPEDNSQATKHQVIMNEPFSRNGLWLFQNHPIPVFDERGQPTGEEGMAFTAASDAGLLLKYLGSFLLVGGMLLMYLLRPGVSTTVRVVIPVLYAFLVILNLWRYAL